MSTVPISTIVHISISLQAQAITEAGFGTPLIVGVNAVGWSERVRTYEGITEVATDFLTTDAEYLAAAAIFSQDPHPEIIKIGRQLSLVAQIQTLVFSANLITANSVDLDVDGVSLTTVPFNTSNAQTLTDIATAIQATAGVATAVSDGVHTITITSQNAGIPTKIQNVIVSGGASQATAAVTTTTPNHGIQEDLAEIIDEDDAWYGFVFTNRTQAHVELAAAFIETVIKIFITASSDTNCLVAASTTDIGGVVDANSYNRTAVIYSADTDQFSDAAWMGAVFPIDPGEETWMFKTLASVIADKLTATQRSGARSKHVNFYVNTGGADMVRDGWMGSGLYIDIRRGADWIQARMEERIFALLKNDKKVPFNNRGIGLITCEMGGVLQNAEEREVLTNTPKFSITAPLAENVPLNEKKLRQLKGLKFKAVLAGAIHDVTVQGEVTS